jgi:hypothetical protein
MDILITLVLLAIAAAGLWIAFGLLKRTVKMAIRMAIAGAVILLVLLGFVWWNFGGGSRAPQSKPATTRPAR